MRQAVQHRRQAKKIIPVRASHLDQAADTVGRCAEIHYVAAARIGGDCKRLDFAVAIDALDGRVVIGTKLEGDIPIFRPGGQQIDFRAVALK